MELTYQSTQSVAWEDPLFWNTYVKVCTCNTILTKTPDVLKEDDVTSSIPYLQRNLVLYGRDNLLPCTLRKILCEKICCARIASVRSKPHIYLNNCFGKKQSQSRVLRGDRSNEAPEWPNDVVLLIDMYVNFAWKIQTNWHKRSVTTWKISFVSEPSEVI